MERQNDHENEEPQKIVESERHAHEKLHTLDIGLTKLYNVCKRARWQTNKEQLNSVLVNKTFLLYCTAGQVYLCKRI